MTRSNDAGYANGFEPPPSSMLAVRIRPGASVPHLDQQSFAQLLEESLGQDEQGRPNLGDDAELNQKLIIVVLQVGLNPFLVSEKEDPFRTNYASGRGIAQLRQCIAVIQLAITRTRHLLYRLVPVEDEHASQLPLYSHLFPKLLSIIARVQHVEITKDVFDVIAAGLQDEVGSGILAASTLREFLHSCLTGLLDIAAKHQRNSSSNEINIAYGDDLVPIAVGPSRSIDLGERFSIQTMLQLLFLASQLATFLSQHESGKLKMIHLRKQTMRLQSIADDLFETSQHASEVESIRAGIGSLMMISPSQIQSFSTVGEPEEWPDSGRARKRARLSTCDDLDSSQISTLEQIVSDVTFYLTGERSSELEGMNVTASAQFRSLSEAKQNSYLARIGFAACQMYTLSVDQDVSCPICDGSSTLVKKIDAVEPLISELSDILLALKPMIQERPNIQPCAFSALSRIVAHTNSSKFLRLKGGSIGDWCLEAMKVSSRETKILVCQCLRAFVRSGSGRDSSLLHENRVVALEKLQALWSRKDATTQESVILALGQMAHVVEDEELNIILLRLVEYLGHTNSYLAYLVYGELQQLAQHFQVPILSLFRPFWRTLSLVVVRDFKKRPTMAQYLSELTGVQFDGILQIIEEHALPYLVLSRNREMVERICNSSSSALTPFEVCTKLNNLPRILSFLLVQGLSDPEQSIMNLLAHICSDFKDQDLSAWVNLSPIPIACELLKSVGDAGLGKESKVYQGLQLLAQLQSRRSSSASSRRTDLTASFLEKNALAIVTHFTAKLNDGAVRELNMEKRRCLLALGEVVKLGKGRVSVALPHICACLHTALEDQALCNTAFHAWSEMMKNVGEDEIRKLLNQTFAIINKRWQILDSKTQDEAYDLVAMLLRDHDTVIRDFYSELPSLANIPVMTKFEAEISRLKKQRDDRNQVAAFISRIEDENMIVVELAVQELAILLREKHDFVHKSILREQPESFLSELTRALLNACVKFDSNASLLMYSAQCLGSIGCLDPSKIESTREKKTFVLLSNFRKADETTGFLMFFMENILVREYISTSNFREKWFLAWSLQQLLEICDLPLDIASRTRSGGTGSKDRQWFELSETTRLILTPFLTSKFVSASKRQKAEITYPFFKPGMTHKQWLTEITLDFLNRGSGDNVDMIFDICCRLVVYGQSTSISSFLLPYAAVNLLLTGIEKDKQNFFSEVTTILQQSLEGFDIETQEQMRLCSQSVFDILDYVSLWLQDTRKISAVARARAERGINDPALDRVIAQTEIIESVLATVPPQVITQRAIECKSYTRALFHQEQYITSKAKPSDADFRRLQDIYAQIDEPDGIEGFSAQMKFLDIESEVMQHKKAGRWNAAQSWYEMQLIEEPQNLDVQINLMKCLKESGQHDVLMHHFDGITSKTEKPNRNLLPFAVEAAWVTDRWDKLSQYLIDAPRGGFAITLGRVMLSLHHNDLTTAKSTLDQMFQSAASELTPSSTVSFEASHESLLKMHILDDVRIMIEAVPDNRGTSLNSLKNRLSILGSNVEDKQYILGVQRALMHLKSPAFMSRDISDSWMTSAKLARKARATQQAFNAILRASALGDKSSAIEQAKLMWQEGDHRKAIQTLDGFIESGALDNYVHPAGVDAMAVDVTGPENRNDMHAKASVLLGKWLDQAGQTQSEDIIKKFRKSTEQNRRWEKGWYNLGRHYNKILESEKSKPPGKESQPFLTGEAAKVVIENFLRALVVGNKYLFQTLPKVLTLWLELVGTNEIEHDARRGNTQFHQHNTTQRKRIIEETNAIVKKYLDRIQPYALYTILPQLVARICHPNPTVNNLLQSMIVKVIKAFPQQALWTVLATVKSASKDRATRGMKLLKKAADITKKDVVKVFNASEMAEFITASQAFSDELLRIADYQIENRIPKINLAKDLHFNHKIAPSKLVVPSEAGLIPNIPTNNDLQSQKTFRAFARDPITISAFLDEARVLQSLQKPRKLSLRGSDGKVYSVLAKPHDDLRKDQRLEEFNTMINRFLKHDLDASKRRLYIKTYAVIPLNEECGLIQWIDGLTTMRDILLKLYEQRGVRPDYSSVREALDKIVARSDDKAKDFIEQVQNRFPPVLYQWFIENFPDPTAWFNARLRYTRTSAVMSMVGHVLGLGDRHGENILFEQGTGGILHVDFNCLFDKGLTFEKPECVPFRLTHNMRHAMGSHQHDGPFRRCCEITTALLRSNEDALMTILETFLHDPTTDFQTVGKKRKTANTSAAVTGYAAGAEVADTPEKMLEVVKGKVRGMLPGESVPLSVGGYVDYMIRQAKDEGNLAMMYIGWCAFF